MDWMNDVGKESNPNHYENASNLFDEVYNRTLPASSVSEPYLQSIENSAVNTILGDFAIDYQFFPDSQEKSKPDRSQFASFGMKHQSHNTQFTIEKLTRQKNEAKSDDLSSMLLGTIIGGVPIGTSIGEPIGGTVTDAKEDSQPKKRARRK
ncbi:MAG: hypothetical protein K2X77_02910 [Candidatus Obscuribacterales bacterium]|jgi:hypothetical protein|nr:hypothetical protein [Candidatus Obscuribacterales bacterium]